MWKWRVVFKRTPLLLILLFPLFIFYCLHVTLPSEKNPLVFYSSHGRDDLRRVIFEAIKKGKKSIFLSTYALTDPALLTLLKQKGKERVRVEIFCDKKANGFLADFHEKNLFFHLIKNKGLMHEKIIIIDHSLLFFSTANMTYSSLSIHENLLLGVYAPDFALEMSHLFLERIEEGVFSKIKVKTCQINKQKLELFLLPDQHQEGLNYLLKTLEEAKERISLSLFTFTHPLLIKKIITMHQRGVKIDLFLDHYSAKGASLSAMSQLQAAGILTHISQGIPLFHHKWALIDNHTLLMGSANWTKAAFGKNQDFFIILSPLSKKQSKYIDNILNIIKLETINNN